MVFTTGFFKWIKRRKNVVVMQKNETCMTCGIYQTSFVDSFFGRLVKLSLAF
jgi:hypothetical protein